MPIENTTVYTKERLLQLTYYVVNTNPHTWILLGITVLCFLMFSATALFNLVMSLLLKLVFKIEMPMDFAPHELGITLLIFLSICVVTVFFTSYLLPLITVNKAKSLNAQLYHRFDSEEMYINSKTSFTANDSTVKYNGLYKVAHSKGNLYMFLDKRQAYIADVSVFTEEQRATLKEALVNQLGAKKVKWKL